ncbi:ankyrin repeat-containing domain protein [Biscogniauxia sp. FL1348]|nr:ankyrin repeat-containing domain protein [Biscogniauxia sp. FL1348]
MVADRSQQTALGHCHKATVLGNLIAIHMLEYITTVSHRHEDLERLAHDFMDVCHIMWSVEAGLVECTQSHQTLPLEMTQELDRKFQTTHADFQALDHWLSRSLSEEKRGTGGKISRGWRKMFSGNEVAKMRDALAKTKEALRMSALVFQWSLGKAKIDDSLGIGYTALSAALERLEKGASATSPNNSSAHLSKERSVNSHIIEVSEKEGPLAPDHLSIPREPTTRSSTSVSPTFPTRGESIIHRLPDLRTDASWSELGQMEFSRKSTASHHTVSTRSGHSRVIAPSDTHEDLRSNGIAELESLTMDDEPATDNRPIKVVRSSVNPTKMPRWVPRNTLGANTPSLKQNLLAAIQERNQKAVEQLLDRGVSPDIGPEYHALGEAITHHDLEIVRTLLLFGADPNAPDRHGMSPLVAALEESFLDAASLLLKYGADPNMAPAAGHDAPFALAVAKEDSDFIRLFLMYGGDVNHIMVEGETILTKAIQNKNCKKVLVDAILDYGADANCKNKEGKTPLFDAITAGRVDIVTSLLNHGANPNLPGPKHMLWPAMSEPACLKVLLAHGADHKKTPGIMELATSINNMESIKILLKAGVNPNAKKDGTYTPLCSAIRDNRADIFHLLLANGADPNMPAAEYPTFKCVTHFRTHFLAPLKAAGADLNHPKGIIETAVQHNNTEAMNWLLDHGVSPNDAAPDTKATPLTTAIRENKLELVELLLSRGANPNVRGQDWPVCMAVRHPAILKRLLPTLEQPRAFKGVMEMAVSANQLESVKLLLAAGISVEDRNGGVFSPLTTAIRERHKEIARYLLEEAGADPNAPGEHLPIIKALRRHEDDSDTEMVEMLLARGADPNKVYRGHNAVIQAVEMGDAHLLRLLIDRCGVDLSALDDAGRTPLEIAEMRGWDEGRRILLRSKKVA